MADPKNRRLFEAFVVLGLRRDAIFEQLEQLEPAARTQSGGSGGTGGSGAYAPGGTGAAVPLSERFFAARSLASFPTAPAGSNLERSLLTLPPFCFPDGVAFARSDPGSAPRVPRFGAFVLTSDDFSRLYGYALEFYEPAPDGLAELAGAGALGAQGWSLPVVIALLARAECARGAEKLLRAIHAAHAARPAGGAAGAEPAAPPLECTISHVVLNTPLPLLGAPRLLLSAAGALVDLGGGGLLCSGLRLPPLHYSLATLTQTLGADALLALLGALLLERRVVFVSSDHARLGPAVLCACSLLYPLVWQNVLVPLLPAAMLDAMHTPFPAILGLRLEQLMAQGRALPDGVVWVHLDRGRVDCAAASALPLRERRWLRAELQRLLGEGAEAGPHGAPAPFGLSASFASSFSAPWGLSPSPSAAAPADPPAPDSSAAGDEDSELQLVLCTAVASLLRDADCALPSALARAPPRAAAGGSVAAGDGARAEEDEHGAWRRHDRSQEAAAEARLLRRPQAERGFVRALLDTQHVRDLLDRMRRAERERQLPAELLGFVALSQRARRIFFSPEPLPAGTAWLALPGEAPLAAGAGAPSGEEGPPPLVIAAETLQPGAPLGRAAADGREQCGTCFPIDLARFPAVQLPLRPAHALATVPIGDDGSLAGGALLPAPRAKGSGLPALALLSDLPLRLGALRDELSIDAHRYAEDADYRADVQRTQGRAGAAATALALGGATAGALLCTVQ